MSELSLDDESVVRSWMDNAAPWTRAVRNNEIASRVSVTNQAIVDTVVSLQPKTLLDVGCGEGWLVCRLASHGIDAIGIDVVPALITYANELGVGDFRILSYAQLAGGELNATFDAIVCNFSLIGEESVSQLFTAAPNLLTSTGSLIVQTLHPTVACGKLPYEDGWRSGSWDGFSSDFNNPPPWYFRTISSWVTLFTKHNLSLVQLLEPTMPDSNQPTSLILVGRTSRALDGPDSRGVSAP